MLPRKLPRRENSYPQVKLVFYFGHAIINEVGLLKRAIATFFINNLIIMKKYFSPGALVTFIIAIVFSVNFLIPQAPAQAQSVSLCETIEALISAGVIAPDRANAARAAAGCLLPPVVPVTELDVDLLSEDIEVEDIDDGYSRAVGFFRFRINSPERDLYVYKAIKDSAVKLLMNGVSVGSPSFINLISASTEGGDTTDYFYVEEGDSRVFTLSYTITPTFGTGYYKAVADRLQLKDWPDYYFDDVESESVFLQGQATSTLLFASEMYLVDTKPTYNAGEIIKYSVKAIASDGTPGDPSRNFNVQAWIFDENTGDTVQVDGEYQSVNASYNDRTRLWDVQMKAPSDTSRTYRVDSAFYCSRPNVLGGCSDKQINKEFRFTIALNGGLGSCPTVLTRDLAVGYSGADVSRLQQFLDIPVTGYFGPILKAAVTAYQSANGISPADGYVGQITRGLINRSICDTPVTPKPTVSLKYKTLTDRDFSAQNTALVPIGTEIILQWESKNTTSCVASASPTVSTWTGTKSVDGLGSMW
jgi:peptidoglycan hydrolase-like protein with peptidoglycan-binding domain